MQNHGISRHVLARESGIPYSTIVSLFTKGYHNAKLSTLRGLRDYFGVTFDYLCDDEITQIQYIDKTIVAEKAPFLSAKAETDDPDLKKLLSNYSNINVSRQYALVDYSSYLAAKQD